MEELKSSPPCPKTVTVRRNPHRKARATPSSAIPLHFPISSSHSIPLDIPSFPIQDILSVEVQDRSGLSSQPEDVEKRSSENLKVFVRIRPLTVENATQKRAKNEREEPKNAWPKNPKPKSACKRKVKSRNETCVTVNDSHSITISPTQNLQDAKRVKSEVYGGFAHVFSSESSQIEVYDKMVKQLVEEFLNGKSGMLAALGPSGSGKTHTVFGCARNPGMVPLALRHIFSEDERNGSQLARTLYLSIFEICSERGKSEKMYDLLGGGMDLYFQKSTVKGLQEVIIRDAQQAESLIACAMLKRATAMTNSNTQSSRSQCIINISYGPQKIEGDGEEEPQSTVLTIVDLAGAEREKKTGNQGLRLLESNFINNTSMVFGLCLRALLEHQKNPKKQLHKHFQSSLLTRYLRAYLEGKKRMSLVLTVKPGEEDYLDTSNLLKQASPFTQIKFTSIEGPGNIKCPKRPIQNFPKAEQLKRMKFCEVEASLIDETPSHGDQPSAKEMIAEKLDDANLTDVVVESEESLHSQLNGGECLKKDDIGLAKRDREHKIMLNFSKALWNVLKQYKVKLEIAENEISYLKDSLIIEKKRCYDLENEVEDLKRQHLYRKEASAEASAIEFLEFRADHSPDIKGSKSTQCLERQFSSPAKASCTEDNAFTEQLPEDIVGRLECLDTHDCDGGSSSPSRDFGTEVTNTNAEESQELIALQTCGNATGEEAGESAGPSENIGYLKDIKEENRSSASLANDVSGPNGCKRTDTGRENEESDHSGTAVSFSQSCIEVKTIHPCSSGEEDLAVSTSSISGTVVCSSSSPVMDSSEDSFAAEVDQLQQDEHEEELDPLAVKKPEEDESRTYTPKLAAKCSSLNTGKPKRRLLPSSCILLKDIGAMAIEEESDKPKGDRGEKKAAMDFNNKTNGSLALLRLLRNELRP